MVRDRAEISLKIENLTSDLLTSHLLTHSHFLDSRFFPSHPFSNFLELRFGTLARSERNLISEIDSVDLGSERIIRHQLSMIKRFEHIRPARSDKYQYVLLETSFAPPDLELIAQSVGVYSFQQNEKREHLLDLDEELGLEFNRFLEQCLTPRQLQIYQLYSTGISQTEIANLLNVNQSSITKSLVGNQEYDRVTGLPTKMYGGTKKKIRRLVPNYQPILTIMRSIWSVLDDRDRGLPLVYYKNLQAVFPTFAEFEKIMGDDDKK